MTTRHIYRFGPFRLDTKAHIFLRNSEPVYLTLKSFKTLLVLVENSGQVVERSALVEQVWPNTFVEEANLTQQVFILRKVMGTDQDGRQYIETVPKLGYRFAATVYEMPDEAGDLREKDQSEAHININNMITYVDKRIDSIAVLPLIEVCNDFDTEYLSDSITESIVNNLSQLRRLRVIALSTVFRCKRREVDPQKIGHELNVRAVVTGSIS